MLFSIEGTGSYLLGTFHKVEQQHQKVPKRWLAAWRETEHFYMESRLDQIPSDYFDRYSSGLSLRDDVGEETYALIRTSCPDIDLDPNVIATLKPWAA